MEGDTTFNVGETILTTRMTDVAADVLLVVDESRSMDREHAWLPSMIRSLEQKLMARGIGSGMVRNLYSLTGFGAGGEYPAQCPTQKLTRGTNRLFPASAYEDVNRQLSTASNGWREDGWHAVKYAIETTPFRQSSGIARNIILVTDEDRDNDCDPTLTAADVTNLLQSNGFTLNAVLNQRYELERIADISTALGVSGGLARPNAAYLAGDSGRYFTIENATVLLSSTLPDHNRFTKTQYVDWTLNQGGAVWDLNFLRTDSDALQQSFTEAFADIKTREILSQTQSCFRCVCMLSADNMAVSECTPAPNAPGCP